ncbi:Uncharacterised protein [Corynebacterium renale]|nr:Uncharacterised protein [Corynebacterium renale]STD70248.1 Uncharacterised protein [Corynebacterium renale]
MIEIISLSLSLWVAILQTMDFYKAHRKDEPKDEEE